MKFSSTAKNGWTPYGVSNGYYAAVEDIARRLGILPTEVADICADARKVFRREAGCTDEQTDSIVWSALQTATEGHISRMIVRAQIAGLLMEQLALRRWFWTRWKADVAESHRRREAELAEMQRRGQYWLAQYKAEKS